MRISLLGTAPSDPLLAYGPITQIVSDSLHSRFCIRYILRFGYSLIKRTEIIYYYYVLHVSKICHIDVAGVSPLGLL